MISFAKPRFRNLQFRKKELSISEIKKLNKQKDESFLRTRPKNNSNLLQGSTSVVVYDSAAVTSESHDPAQAVLYYRPRETSNETHPADGQHDPVTLRTALAGQLAGVLTFASSCFGAVKKIRLMKTTVVVSTQGRFVLMVCGHKSDWAERRLASLSSLLDMSTGGLVHLWSSCNRDRDKFIARLIPLMDKLVESVFVDVTFEENCDSSSSTTPTVVSPYSDISNPSLSSETRHSLFGVRKKSPVKDVRECFAAKKEKVCRLNALERLHTILDVPPCVQMPKSGMCGVFLKGQRAVEVCVQQSGVIAGMMTYQNKVLSSQMNDDLSKFLLKLSSSSIASTNTSTPNTPELDSLDEPPLNIEKFPLEKLQVDFQQPNGVTLHRIHLLEKWLTELQEQKQCYKSLRVRDRGNDSLHNESSTYDLSTLRNILLEHQSLHNYPSGLPGFQIDNYSCSEQNQISSFNYTKDYMENDCYSNSNFENSMNPPTLDPLQLCAKINRNRDLLEGDRPSQSLPGTPRKIRVSAMLPDVGNNSPDLRYKVLNDKRYSRPAGSSLAFTPRHMMGRRGRNRSPYFDTPSRSQQYSDSSVLNGVNSLPRRTNMLLPPSLSLSYDINRDEELKSKYSIDDETYREDNTYNFCKKGGSKSRFSVKSGDSGFEEMGRNDADTNYKNAKNKFKLQISSDKKFQPGTEKVNEDISNEINGNCGITRDLTWSKVLLDDLKRLEDDEDSSRSGSEISVLELSSFIDTKMNDHPSYDDNEKTSMECNDNEIRTSNLGTYYEGGKDQLLDPDHNSVDLELLSPSDHSPASKPLCLYQHTIGNTCLCLILQEEDARDPKLIYSLWGIGQATLLPLESQIIRSMDMSNNSQSCCGGDSVVRKFGQSVFAVEPDNLNLSTIDRSMNCFTKRPELLEITVRVRDNTVWAHRVASSITFYQHNGITRPGPPIPSDPMAKLPQRARRRLERDYAITLF